MTTTEKRAVIARWITAARKDYFEKSKHVSPHSGLGMCVAFHDTAWQSEELTLQLADILRDEGKGYAVRQFVYEKPLYNPVWLRLVIPEFNPEFLGGIQVDGEDYWWPWREIEPRIRAFDKLMDAYKN